MISTSMDRSRMCSSIFEMACSKQNSVPCYKLKTQHKFRI
ncbi:hypothetical protein LEP1GSC161_3368 [Leptospira santarosai str. CBC1416]|uniref:Uncharacterized protein n=1 Tax=Leptospira santarosai str. CBC1416 TaxID=1193059 RepID=M6VSN0_9LEPT|nr:hypothetical protein LEP1GSC161_3368 [Leptospira santarosai str. CBC1416]